MINSTEIKSRLNDVFRDVFEDDQICIQNEMTAKDVEGWDSLSHITLIVCIEKEFNVTFSAAEVGSFANVGQLIGALTSRAKK